MVFLARPPSLGSDHSSSGSGGCGENRCASVPPGPTKSKAKSHHGFMRSPGRLDPRPRELRRQDSPGGTEATTVLSGSSSPLSPLSPLSPRRRRAAGAGGADRRLLDEGKKKRGLRRLAVRRRRRKVTESQLRRGLRKCAERGEWDAVRKLLARHSREIAHPEVPRGAAGTTGTADMGVIPEEPPPAASTAEATGGGEAARRNSYGERRSSFGGASAAAAAVVRDAHAAAAWESSETSDGSFGARDAGENALHDVCRHRPPLDVIETLLEALSHREGCTRGTDDEGRTPLHLAADSGASPDIVAALVRADLTPASVGDCMRCSPLHLAVKHYVYGGCGRRHGGDGGNKKESHEESSRSPAQVLERTLEIARILKEAMLAFPGKIDYKDEDVSGFSPLDYAIYGDADEALVNLLLRRFEPRRRRADNAGGLRRSSLSEDQDFEIVEKLEQEEVEVRRRKVEGISMRHKERDEDGKEKALYDVFGIDRVHGGGDRRSALKRETEVEVQVEEPDNDECVGPSRNQDIEPSPRMTDDDIRNRHLEDYLNEYLDNTYDGANTDGPDGDDGFDIFHDPDEEEDEAAEGDGVDSDEDVFPFWEVDLDPDFLDDDEEADGASIVSEITFGTAVAKRRT
ncbi:hypothetical protein ACHAWF_002059 [Thalassiosira exigua]